MVMYSCLRSQDLIKSHKLWGQFEGYHDENIQSTCIKPLSAEVIVKVKVSQIHANRQTGQT